jgi:hypothetical protein
MATYFHALTDAQRRIEPSAEADSLAERPELEP